MYTNPKWMNFAQMKHAYVTHILLKKQSYTSTPEAPVCPFPGIPQLLSLIDNNID